MSKREGKIGWGIKYKRPFTKYTKSWASRNREKKKSLKKKKKGINRNQGNSPVPVSLRGKGGFSRDRLGGAEVIIKTDKTEKGVLESGKGGWSETRRVKFHSWEV